MSDNSSGSEWIYILLTILAGGISMLKSAYNKKKAQQERQEGSSHDELFGPTEEYAEEQEEERPMVATFPNANLYKMPEDKPLSEPLQEGDYYRERTRKTVLSPKAVEAEQEEEELDFDPRKAIIYSEILKRKY